MLDQIKKDYVQQETVDLNTSGKMKTLIEHSFGIEEYAVEDVRDRIERADLDVDYPRIDLEFLRMRKKGWPRFAVYTLDSPIAYVQTRLQRDQNNWGRQPVNYLFGCNYGNESIGLNHPLDEYFEDTFNNLKKKCMRKKWFTRKISRAGLNIYSRIQTKFNGLIPPRVRIEIMKAKNVFGRGIYLVGEVEKWTLKEHVEIEPVRRVDPLVIGVKSGVGFLIDSFDLAPVEVMVRREFTDHQLSLFDK